MGSVEEKLLRLIKAEAEGLPETTLMEVCGTHTHEIRRLGIREAMPQNIHLVSGPGCPVCVTHERDVFFAVSAAKKENTVFCCFGDMMRVPCSAGSLMSLKESGNDVRIVLSPLDALKTAQSEPEKQVVYFGVGFETTTPHTAALIEEARRTGTDNLSVFCTHKTMPGAIDAVLSGKGRPDALICPGHVAALTGRAAFDFVPGQFGVPAAVAGFGAAGILAAVHSLLRMLGNGEKKCINMYPEVVTENGNPAAKQLVESIFEPCDALWRGLGEIPGTGLKIREEFAAFDAAKRFGAEPFVPMRAESCICSSILKGESEPEMCKNFGGACTPLHPIGPCMVSSEGSCAAAYKYRQD